MTTCVLEARGITWSVGGTTILDGVDLEVGPGELLAVIGPNGAGKSSLLHVLSGVRRPTSGSVHLLGRDVTRSGPARRAVAGLGRTFQTSSLFGGLEAQENVRLAVQSRLAHPLAPWRRAGGAAEAAEVADLLERVGMAHRSRVLAGDLSHGDRRKLEVAVALARRPSVLLLDEPIAGVSVEDVPALVDLIGALPGQGVGVVMVEHHMHVVLGLARRIAVLHHGSLLAVGTADEVTADPVVQQAYLGEPV